MSAEENKAVMQRIFEEILNEGKIEKSNELVANDYVYHGPGSHELKGVEGFKKFMIWIHNSFPGAHFTIDDLIAEGDKVVTFFTMKGTHKSNKPVNFQGIVICRIVSGKKEVEVWEIFDRFTIALQLAPGWAKVMLHSIEKQMVKDRP
jgi:predicted ester cyclase